MGKERMEAGRGRSSGVVNRASTKHKVVAGAGGGGGKRRFYLVLAVLLIAGIATLSYMAVRPAPASVFALDSAVVLVPNQGHMIGSDSAPVEVVEFADFECPACGNFATLTEPDVRTRLVNAGLIRYRFMDFPLDGHRNTWPAHMAAWCASEQGKFWEMHDAIFQAQDRWSGYATSRPEAVLSGIAQQVGLNTQQYNACVSSRKFTGQIRANYDEGMRRGVGSTPTFFIGTRKVATNVSYDQFKRYVDDAIAESRTKAASPSGAKSGTKSAAKTP